MRVVVTGGAGFIGSNFVHYLLEHADHEVVTLDALTYAGTTDNLEGAMENPRHEFVEGDVRDRQLVDDVLTEADYVVNFAAESHVDRSIEGSGPFVSTNIQGTRTLLDSAIEAGIERFVQISTDEVYGEIESGTFSEEDCLAPRNPYAATKAGADLLALSYHETHGLPVVVTRSSNIYGPRQHPEKLIPKLVVRADAGQPLPLYGDGSNVREWLFVEDNCRAISTLVEGGKAGEIYNVGSGTRRTNLEVARAVVELVGAGGDLIEFVEDRPGHDSRYALDSSKLRSLGWSPEWTFEAGLRDTVEWYLQ